MPLIETLSLELGSSIAKALLKSWLKNSDMAVDASSSLVDVLKSWTADKTTQRRAQRQFEEIGEKVGESLLPIFEKEGANLDEGSRNAVALAVAQTLNSASSAVLAQNNLASTELTTYLLHHPFGTEHFNETEQLLYQRIISESCERIVTIASQLPAFTEQTFAEILKREHRLLDIAQQTLEEVRRLREHYTSSVPAQKQAPLQRPRRAEHFVNREAGRTRLLADLKPGRVVTVCGLGGMGKTALVAEVLSTLAPAETPPPAFPDGILFYSFYGQPTVTIALEHIARTLGEEPVPTPALAAQRALAGQRVLLVLDGTEEADHLEQLLSVCGENAVLLTSRKRADAPDPAYRLDLQPLLKHEAVSVVQAFGGELAADVSATSRICECVGNLPLALRLVGRYLAEQEEEASEYLTWLEHTPLSALDQGISRERSVSVLLERSTMRLSATAQRVLGLVGLLALAAFDRALVTQTLELSEEASRRALGELVNYGVLVRQQSRYEVSHPLIHTYARQALLAGEEATQQAAILARLITVLTEHFPEVDHPNWEACERLVPHIQACAAHLELQGTAQAEAAALFDQAGQYLQDRARYEQAALLLQRALAIREQQVGPHHPHTATSLNNLALLYRAQGKYPEAELLLQRALAIREHELGSDHPDTATSLNNLARLYRAQGKYAEAEPLYQRALAICEQQLGASHPMTTVVRQNYTALLQDFSPLNEQN